MTGRSCQSGADIGTPRDLGIPTLSLLANRYGNGSTRCSRVRLRVRQSSYDFVALSKVTGANINTLCSLFQCLEEIPTYEVNDVYEDKVEHLTEDQLLAKFSSLEVIPV